MGLNMLNMYSRLLVMSMCVRLIHGENNFDNYQVVRKVLENLLSYQDIQYDVVLIISNQEYDLARNLTSELSNKLSNAVSVFSPKGTLEKSFYRHQKECYIDDNLDKLTKNPKLILTYLKTADELEMVLKGLSNTITNCTTFLRAGYYHQDNLIAHFIDDATGNMTLPMKVFEDMESRRHRRVMAMKRSGDNLSVMQYNVYASSISTFNVATGTLDEYSDDFVRTFSMEGFTIKVVTLPFDSFVIGDIRDNEENPRKALTITGGQEVDMINLIGEHYGFSVDYSNPADMQWGNVDRDEPFGFFKDILDGKADLGMSAMGTRYNNGKVMRFSGANDVGVFTIISPNPKAKRSVFRILHPLNTSVWLSTLACLLFVPLFIYAISRLEEYATGKSLFWSTLENSFWYTFSTLIGENITPTIKSRHAWAIRCLCLVWTIVAFIVTASYSGNLRAFLINPVVGSPIDTMEQLVRSDLTWKIVLYGEPFEQELADSSDPVLHKFWEEKEELPYNPSPYDTLLEVYEGKSAMLDFQNTFDNLAAAFTLPNGQRLMHKARQVNLGDKAYSTFLMHRLNPFTERITHGVYCLWETGIHQRMTYLNKQLLIERNRVKLKSEGVTTPAEKLLNSSEDETVNRMELDDLIGVFGVYFSCLGILAIVQAIEMMVYFRKNKKRQ